MFDLFLEAAEAKNRLRPDFEGDERRERRRRRFQLAAFLWFPGLLVVMTLGVWAGLGSLGIAAAIVALLFGLGLYAVWDRVPRSPHPGA